MSPALLAFAGSLVESAAVFALRPAARSAAAISPSTVRSCGRISACASLRAG